MYRFVQRLMTCDVTHVVWLDAHTLQPPPALPVDIRLQQLAPAEVARYASDSANRLEPALAWRAGQGLDFCFAAIRNGRLAAYLWCARHSIEAHHNRGRVADSGVAVALPRDAVFLYKGFTRPEYRGRGLYRSLIAYALSQLAPRGVRTIVSSVDWTNQAALASFYHAGFQFAGRCWRFGWRGCMGTVAPDAAQCRGATFGRHAAAVDRDPPPEAADSSLRHPTLRAGSVGRWGIELFALSDTMKRKDLN